MLTNPPVLEHQPILKGKIDTLIGTMISQGGVDLVLDGTLVNTALNFYVNIFVSLSNNSEFVTDIMEPEAHDDENVPIISILKEILDDVVVTKVRKLMATSFAPLRKRTIYVANQDLESMVKQKKKEK